MKRTLVATVVGVGLLPSLTGAPASAATLTVRVDGAGAAGATVYVALCKGALDERSCLGVARGAARPGRMTFRLPVANPGRYAVVAYEDENGNGRLDRLFGIPQEPHGLSNGTGRGGIPSFEQAAFDLREPGATVDITLGRIGR